MIFSETLYYAQMLNPIDATGATVTPYVLDTLNFDFVTVVIGFGNVAANVTTCILSECETSNGSFTDITGSGGTVTAAGGDGQIIITNVDYRSKGTHKRFLQLTLTGGAGATLVYAVAICTPKVTPTSSTTAGTGSLAGTAKTVNAWNNV